MAYNTKEILKDKDLNPISQYYNPTTDSYEPVQGVNGGNKVVVDNNDLSLLPILDKLSQLTGTVIDEETRKSNENSRKSVEATRVTSETARKTAETGRVTAETDRVTKEADRVIKETDRVSKETTRVSSENTRVSNENTRKTNETTRGNNEVIRVDNENLRIALYDDLNNKLTSGFFKGAKGDTGNGLEYIWNGTQLGIRVQGTTQYVYVDLKGAKGDTGSIENLTSQHVTNALGYTPPQQDTITTINGKTGAIAKADIVALGIPSADTNTTYTAGAGLTLTGTVFTPTFGTTAGTITQGNDSRLSNSRTPLAHSHTIGDLPPYPTTLPANGGNASTVGGFTVGISVPANAKFTDTIYTHPAGTNPHGTTKSDVVLGNVDNIKQMPISGGDFTGMAKAQNNTSYTVPQLRNIFSGTANPSGGSNGDIYFKRKA